MVWIKIEALDKALRAFTKPPRQVDAAMDFEFGQARRKRGQRSQPNQERPQPEAE